MTLALLPFIALMLLSLVAGQLLLKSALDGDGVPFPRRAAVFAGGIGGMTISFFTNLWLLRLLPLSILFPFQGLCVIIVTLGASVFLKERLTLPLVIGALLITAGVMLVSTS